MNNTFLFEKPMGKISPEEAQKRVSMDFIRGKQYCIRCNLDKPLDEFPRNKRRLGGYHTYCKACSNIDSAKYYKEHNTSEARLVRSIQFLVICY